MKQNTKYNLQFAGITIGVVLLIVFGMFMIACAAQKQQWAFIMLACIMLGFFGFVINEWRKDYIADKKLGNSSRKVGDLNN